MKKTMASRRWWTLLAPAAERGALSAARCGMPMDVVGAARWSTRRGLPAPAGPEMCLFATCGDVGSSPCPSNIQASLAPGCIPSRHLCVLCCVHALPQPRSRSAVTACPHLEASNGMLLAPLCPAGHARCCLHIFCAADPGSMYSVSPTCVDAGGHPGWAPRVLASTSAQRLQQIHQAASPPTPCLFGPVTVNGRKACTSSFHTNARGSRVASNLSPKRLIAPGWAPDRRALLDESQRQPSRSAKHRPKPCAPVWFEARRYVVSQTDGCDVLPPLCLQCGQGNTGAFSSITKQALSLQ